MSYVNCVLPADGEMKRTGLVLNDNMPLRNYTNISMPVDPTHPAPAYGFYSYTIDNPDKFYYDVPNGWIISKAVPEKVTVAYIKLAAFQLYETIDGVDTPVNKWLAWYYRVRHWNKHTAGTPPNEYDAVDYTIDIKVDFYEEDTSDRLAPYIYSAVISTFPSLSGTIRESASSNVVGMDNRYIGFVLHIDKENNRFGILVDMRQWLYLEDNRWVINASSTGGIGIFCNPNEIGQYKIVPQIKTDPNDDNGGRGATGGGGGGDRDDHIDPIPFPQLPSLSATAAGFVTLYNPTIAQIKELANEINSETLWDSFKNFFDHAEDYVAGLGIIPVEPDTGASVYPRFGWFHFDTAMPLVINQFKIVDCGQLDITEFYGSAFDYSGMTSISLYLPYIGYREIDVDGAMARTMHIKYYVDVYSGNCVALIGINEIVQYHFSGNCMQQIPVSAISFNDMLKNGITLAAALGVGLLAGGAGGAAVAGEAATSTEVASAAGEAQAGGLAASTMSNNAAVGSTMESVMSNKPTVTRSGALGSSAGMLGVQYPYIIRKIPRQSWPTNYNAYAGYPCNMTVQLNALSGFFAVDSINLSNVPATENEISEILAYLKGGVLK